MVYKVIQVILLAIFIGQSCLASTIAINQDEEERSLFPNREHRIFNAVGSALRTEASVANPNGMSAFLAYIEEGTSLYHGTYREEEVKGYEWVSFDPNFASLFARIPPGARRAKPPPSSSPPPNLRFQNTIQTPFTISTPEEDWPDHPGNLRTYTPAHPLRLLYLDGLSAIKRVDGSLDFQDHLLLFNKSMAVMADYYRAEKLCEMKRNRWQDKIDGFIRKDFEFEIIICQFEKELREVDRVTLSSLKREDIKFEVDWNMTILPNEARDDTIVQSAVRVDYEGLVSVWDYPINVFEERNNQTRPRLNRVTKQEREMVLNDLDRLILEEKDSCKNEFYDWQAVADAIVARYGPVFQAFNKNFDNKHNRIYANETLTNSIFMHIDVENRSREKEMSRCINTMYRIPKGSIENPTVVSKSFQVVLSVICSTLLDAYEENDLWKSQRKLQNVSKILYWTPWVRHQPKHIEPWSTGNV